MSEERLTATVGIVTYGRPRYMARLLESLLDQTRFPDEILVVDDSHADPTRAAVEERISAFERRGTTLRYLPRSGPDSMPGARNTVIDCAGSDIVCFLDDDVVCEPEWFESILRGFEENPEMAAVGGPAISVDEDLEPLREIVRHPENQNHVDGYGGTTSRVKDWIPPDPVETDRLGGANMAFRRETLVSIGGFDLAYDRGPAKFEETDVMARLIREGHRLLYHPGALVYHFEARAGGSRTGMTRADLEGEYWFARNYVLFRRKNTIVPFWLSVVHLIVLGLSPGQVCHLLGALLDRDPGPLYRLRGYVDGVVLDSLLR